MNVLPSLYALAVLALSPVLAAQDAAGAPPVVPKSTSKAAEILHNSGVVGQVIILLSIVALTLIIKEFMAIRRDKLAPPELVDEMEALFEAGEYQEAIELCESEPSYFSNVVAAGLLKLNASFEAMEQSLTEMLEEETLKIHARLSWLSLLASVGPMLGLLGTVQGMIMAFNMIAAMKGQATPDQLAHSISVALLTTFEGLCVAIPVTSAFVYLRNRTVAYSLEISAVVEDLFERFRPKRA